MLGRKKDLWYWHPRKMVEQGRPPKNAGYRFHKSESGWFICLPKDNESNKIERCSFSFHSWNAHWCTVHFCLRMLKNVYFTNLNRETSHANERSRWPDSPLLKFAFFYGKANLFKPPCNYGTGQNALRHWTSPGWCKIRSILMQLPSRAFENFL